MYIVGSFYCFLIGYVFYLYLVSTLQEKNMRINFIYKNDNVKKKTTIGRSNLSRPLNKHKRRQWKKYRGQGK